MEEADLPIERAPTRCQSRFLTLMLENVNGPDPPFTIGSDAAAQSPDQTFVNPAEFRGAEWLQSGQYLDRFGFPPPSSYIGF